ncbi:MAG: T9SS type A sorting domain-containing protein, partial [Bacteroidales bacterium]|nr:T9SS type A sorting domain-containing protein [Bacteroidales bacterium]
IFPNPTTDKVTIKTDEMINHVSIYSFNGQQLDVVTSQTSQPHQQTIDISKYPKGVYLIEVGFEDGSTVRERIIKQ